MCQYSSTKERVRTAKANVTVWKVVKTGKIKGYWAMFHDFAYEIGKTYKARPQGRAFNDLIYVMRKTEADLSHCHPKHIVLEGEGFHSYRFRRDAETVANRAGSDRRIMKCVIPKESKYIEGFDMNDRFTIVSNRIKTTKVELPQHIIT